MLSYKINQIVITKSGKAEIIGFTSYGTRRGDIRNEILNADREFPILKGIDFVGYINIVPNNVPFLYGHEQKEYFII